MHEEVSCEYCGSVRDVDIRANSNIYLCMECWFQPPSSIVTLCGSTRFADDFKRVMLRETLAGKIVLTVGTHERIQEIHDDVPVKRMLDCLHMRKIRLATKIIIINKDGYIGESTARELAMARKLGKEIIFEWPEYVRQ